MLWSSHARIRALIAATTDAVFRMSPDWSEMWLLIGRDFMSDNTLPTQAWLQKYVHPDDQGSVLSAIREAVRTKRIFQHTNRVLRIDGTVGWAFCRAVPLIAADGGITEWIGSARDITEQKWLEQALQEHAAELEQRTNDLARLAEQVSLAQHWERRQLADEIRDDLQQALVAALLRTRSLVSAVEPSVAQDLSDLEHALNHANATARRITKSLTPPLSLSEQLTGALQWLANDLTEKYGMALTVRLSEQVGPVLEGTGVFLYTAARELLMNVVQHAGTLSAELALCRKGDRISLLVRDRGRGFDRAKVLEQGRDGFGLLSIEERIKLLGGDFEIEVAPGQGVTVEVSLREVRARSAQSQVALSEPSDVPSAWVSEAGLAEPGSVRLLVADDHSVVRQALARLLSETDGLEVVGECCNGREALEQAEQLHPAVVIMDVSMPVMDGIEATRRIKARWPDIKVIGLSVYSDADGGNRMRSAGADAYLSKTAPPEQLIEQIFLCVDAAAANRINANPHWR